MEPESSGGFDWAIEGCRFEVEDAGVEMRCGERRWEDEGEEGSADVGELFEEMELRIISARRIKWRGGSDMYLVIWR